MGPSVVVYRNGATREVRYQHLDRLGSVDAVTRDDGTELMVDAHGYDPWGKPRGGTWTSSQERLHPNGDRPPAPLDLAQAVATDRGFTGHEHLDAHYLIHMNGRVYDYRLGRFLSVDPIISDPGNPQAVNPYSYIGNNPLSGVDPTGYVGCTKSTGTHTCGFTRMWDVFMSASRDWVGLGAGTGASISSDSGADKQEAKTAKTSTTDAKSPGQTAKQQDGTAGRPADANGASAENARNGATTTASAVAQKLGGVLLAATDDPGTGISRSSAQQVAAEQNAAACAGGEDCTPVYLSAAMSAVLVAGAAAEAAAAAAAEATASVAALRNVRAEYLRKVGELVAKAKGGVESGRSIEEVAREAAAGRNALKLAERAAGPWWAARWADLRNLVRYGNRAGPTADQLFKREGSWERVLQKVGQTDPTYDRLAR